VWIAAYLYALSIITDRDSKCMKDFSM